MTCTPWRQWQSYATEQESVSVMSSKLLLSRFHRCEEMCFKYLQTPKDFGIKKGSLTLFMEHSGGFSKVPCDEWPSSSKFGCVNGGQGRREWGGIGFWKAPQRQSLNNHVSSAGLHYPPVRQAECQPRIAGWLWQGQRRRKNQLLCYSGAEWRGAAICQLRPAIPAEQMDTGGQRRGHRHP